MTVLHPSYKTAYFEKAGWLPEWIEIAEGLVRKQFAAKYADREISVEADDDGSAADDEDEESPRTQVRPCVCSAWTPYRLRAHWQRGVDSEVNLFDNLPFLNAAPEPADSDEIKRYLAADVIPMKDPISWWQGKRKQFPRLSRMAIDYLNIPGTLNRLSYRYILC